MTFQVEAAQQRPSRVARLRQGLAMHFLQRQGDIFLRGQVREQVERLKNCSYRPPMAKQRRLIVMKPFSVQFHLTRIGSNQPRKDSQQCRFSAPGWPDQYQAVNVFNAQRHAIQGGMSPKPL